MNLSTAKLNTKLMLAAALTLAACNQQKVEEPAPIEQQPDSPALVMVNGEAITQADVDFMIERTFSGSEQLFFDEKMQAKVLDSLIASKAMQQKMLAELSEDQLQDIKNRAKAFEEELYVKEYLVQHATPEPVSSKMVQNYYQQYPEEFGGGERRLFEMLATSSKPSEAERDAIIAVAKDLQNNKAWKDFGVTNTLGLVYKQASMQPGLFAASLERAVKNTKVGQASNVVLVKGAPHIVRVLNAESLPAKPLSEVSAQIRKKLAALQLKKAVKSASETAISEAKVVRK